MSVPIHRLERDERARAVRRFVGNDRVEIEVDIHRDGSRIDLLTGRLMAVASPCGPGPQSDTVVLRTSADRVLAIAITRVRSIRRVD